MIWPWSTEGEATEQSLQRFMTPEAKARIAQALGKAPEQYFGNTQVPKTMADLGDMGILGDPRTRELLFQLLQLAHR